MFIFTTCTFRQKLFKYHEKRKETKRRIRFLSVIISEACTVRLEFNISSMSCFTNANNSSCTIQDDSPRQLRISHECIHECSHERGVVCSISPIINTTSLPAVTRNSEPIMILIKYEVQAKSNTVAAASCRNTAD